ncbi:hypothetical protein RRG08_038226 [Elysia crispata]|uniref:Uncharacterized protein n=1 Tax=Elysia crispata TaxID=231223 RepID=A0AAE1ANB8_9GAST|nr:hypothetical protein RRG08_038226 [Elysia crispata]
MLVFLTHLPPQVTIVTFLLPPSSPKHQQIRQVEITSILRACPRFLSGEPGVYESVTRERPVWSASSIKGERFS